MGERKSLDYYSTFVLFCKGENLFITECDRKGRQEVATGSGDRKWRQEVAGENAEGRKRRAPQRCSMATRGTSRRASGLAKGIAKHGEGYFIGFHEVRSNLRTKVYRL